MERKLTYYENNSKIKKFSYPIIIGSDILRLLPNEISQFTKSKKIFILIKKFLSKKFESKLNNHFRNNGFECLFFKVEAGKKCKELNVL